MITFELATDTLKAARLIAADGDIRYYLNGIYFDLRGARVVSTDGHRMLIADGARIDAEPFIMPNDHADNVLKACKGKNAPAVLTFTLDGSDWITVTVGEQKFTAKKIDGIYPTYRQVIPQSVSGDIAAINLEYLADAQKAISTFRGHRGKSVHPVRVFHNGKASAIVSDGQLGVMVIVMPIRYDGTTDATEILKWAHGKLNLSQAA